MRRKSRRQNRIVGVAAILLGLLLFFFAAGRLRGTKEEGGLFRRTDAAEFSQTQTIILDPGHGGADGGAVGTNDVAEKELNLAISLKLRDMLELQGFTVYMTRETDEMTCDPGLSSLTAQKKSDMHNRLALMDAHPEAIVLSIHQNKFEQQKYHGAQMFYGKNHEMSAALAQAIQDSLVSRLQPENERQIKQGEQNLFLLWEAENPIVLVECGFLSNPEECEKLCSDEYQSQVAFTILAGLMEALAAGGV